MGTASFCGGVRHKRYSVQQETAPNSKLKILKNKKAAPGQGRAAFYN